MFKTFKFYSDCLMSEVNNTISSWIKGKKIIHMAQDYHNGILVISFVYQNYPMGENH